MLTSLHLNSDSNWTFSNTTLTLNWYMHESSVSDLESQGLFLNVMVSTHFSSDVQSSFLKGANSTQEQQAHYIIRPIARNTCQKNKLRIVPQFPCITLMIRLLFMLTELTRPVHWFRWAVRCTSRKSSPSDLSFSESQSLKLNQAYHQVERIEPGNQIN